MTARSDICVVGGAGHVGLPLAMLFAQAGRRVTVVDTDRERLRQVRSGLLPFREEGGEQLLEEVLATGRLRCTTDPAAVAGSEVVLVAIGAPAGKTADGLRDVLESWLVETEPHIQEGALLVLRSTLPPGTASEVAGLLRERGRLIDVGVCPERVVEGRSLVEIKTLTQIVGAETPEAAERCVELFATLGIRCVRATPMEAELAKILANTWRYVTFAVANEFGLIAAAAGVDHSNVLELVRDGYPRASGLPGPGFAGGPCLWKDASQLVAVGQGAASLTEAAIAVNEGMPERIVEMAQGCVLLDRGGVALLGMAYKAESDDTRGAMSYRLRRLLEEAGARVACHDPFVTDPDLVDLDTALEGADLVIVGAAHAAFRGLEIGDRALIDPWGVVDGRVTLGRARGREGLGASEGR